jgi:hypothetical protein
VPKDCGRFARRYPGRPASSIYQLLSKLDAQLFTRTSNAPRKEAKTTVVALFEFLRVLGGLSSRPLRLKSVAFRDHEQQPLTAKFAKEKPQSTRRNSN